MLGPGPRRLLGFRSSRRCGTRTQQREKFGPSCPTEPSGTAPFDCRSSSRSRPLRHRRGRGRGRSSVSSFPGHSRGGRSCRANECSGQSPSPGMRSRLFSSGTTVGRRRSTAIRGVTDPVVCGSQTSPLDAHSSGSIAKISTSLRCPFQTPSARSVPGAARPRQPTGGLGQCGRRPTCRSLTERLRGLAALARLPVLAADDVASTPQSRGATDQEQKFVSVSMIGDDRFPWSLTTSTSPRIAREAPATRPGSTRPTDPNPQTRSATQVRGRHSSYVCSKTCVTRDPSGLAGMGLPRRRRPGHERSTP